MDEQKTNKEDQDIIKGAFADNEQLLKLVRALFFGLDTSDEEKGTIKTAFSSKPLRDIMWRRFYPQLDRETPIGQVQDVWLGSEKMIFGSNKGTIKQAMGYKEKSLEMTKQALELLENPYGKPVSISFDIKKDLGISLLARNQFLRHVESQLLYLWMIASQKKETPAEEAKRIAQDSSK